MWGVGLDARHLRRKSRSCIKSVARKSRIILRNGNTRTSIFHSGRVSWASSAALWEIFAESTAKRAFCVTLSDSKLACRVTRYNIYLVVFT